MNRFGDIAVELSHHVALVELQRPPHNFFDVALIGDLADAFEALDADPACRVSVLAAAGKSFCAGANFITATPNDGPATVDADPLYRAAVRVFRAEKPIVAAIQGAAIGGGLGLALAADFRVVSAETRFAANFVKLGIHPGFGLTHTLPRLIGGQKAALMFLTGRRIDGATALAWGLADILATADQLRAAAFELAHEIAAAAPLAVQSTRATLRHGLAEQVARQTAHEFAEQSRLFATADHAEGVRAVAERRAGRFTGA